MAYLAVTLQAAKFSVTNNNVKIQDFINFHLNAELVF